jgi:AcrR family transcriptional regulator
MSNKRDDVIRGAFAVFGREGYVSASIDAIAREAGVSTRTIYNHFTDKEALFRTTLEDSAARVAAAHIALMEHHLRDAVNLEASLIAFALAWISPAADTADHFALLRRIQAERAQLPRAAVEAWRRVGPLRVKRELASYLGRFAERGWLRLNDPQRAALQLASLVSHAESWVGGSPTPTRAEELRATVESSVRVFLYGYATGRRRGR